MRGWGWGGGGAGLGPGGERGRLLLPPNRRLSQLLAAPVNLRGAAGLGGGGGGWGGPGPAAACVPLHAPRDLRCCLVLPPGAAPAVGSWARIENKAVIGEDVFIKVGPPAAPSLVLPPTACLLARLRVEARRACIVGKAAAASLGLPL